jgi:hypothetical protein
VTALQWALVGAWHVEVITVLALVGVRGTGVAFDATLVAEVTLEIVLSAEVR